FMTIGLGALKYFIIKVDPRKTILFDPRESIDFNGNTGPFIQYTYARIKSILRKAENKGYKTAFTQSGFLPKEIEILKIMASLPDKISEAAAAHSPALVANYAYDLAKEFNQYYHDVSILKEENDAVRSDRLALLVAISKVLVKTMTILGIKLPERM
ncbi:MAG: arginine--tRNA ligase, partial [Bacteroidales bacterium]|nr:arginine--tRNA ligase [Bacteroidales bacterium]